MKIEKKIKGGILTTIGFLLSPLSWWNDLYVNFPLAYFFAYSVSLIDPKYFAASLIVFYLTSNVLGLILFHNGVATVLPGNSEKTKNDRRKLLIKIIVAVVYTTIIIFLVNFDILKLPQEYFK